MNLTLTITREVKPIEVVNLVWGTGALTWEWWRGASLRRYVDGKSVIVPSEGGDYENTVQGDDYFLLKVDDPDEAEGSGKTIKKQVYLRDIVAAASSALQGIGAHIDEESARDMRVEDLGYADALAADSVLQLAVFGKVVYG